MAEAQRVHLISFRASNHRAFRAPFELSAVAGGPAEHAESLIEAAPNLPKLVPAIGIYGANASGKSTVLNALSFFVLAVRDSHRDWNPEGGVPRTPFALNTESSIAPSSFEIDLAVAGVRFTYGFRVDSRRVLEEWLHAYPNGRRQKWLSRHADTFEFSRLLPGENSTIQRLTRANSLFLSVAAQNNHELLVPIHGALTGQFRFVAGERSALERATAELARNASYQARLLGLLRVADLGVSDLNLREEELPESVKRLIGRMSDDDDSVFRAIQDHPYITRIVLSHKTGGGAPFPLPWDSESAGTRALLALGGPMLMTLASGGVLLVDELEESLHPLLAEYILRQFQDPRSNPHRAQLIFNTHNPALLSADLLRRDQVWFSEKGEDGSARLFPLTDYRPTRRENVVRGYLQGRYGAVPYISAPWQEKESE